MIRSPFLCSIGLVALVASGQTVEMRQSPVIEKGAASPLLAPPSGSSSVMGGSIAKVDPVHDSLELLIPGGHPAQILFDARTQLFRDGQRVSILDLRPSDHASIETRLDGSAVFAVRIHVLSSPPDGRLKGQVVSYEPATMELGLHVADERRLVKLTVPVNTPMSRMSDGNTATGNATDLMRGALVDVSFQSDKKGHGSATHIEVLAIPGAISVLRGSLSALDMRAGRMTIDPLTSETPTDVSFDRSHFPASANLRIGLPVRVSARFDGSHYVAIEIVPE